MERAVEYAGVEFTNGGTGRPKEMMSACGGQQMTDVKNMTERESYIIAQALYEFIGLEHLGRFCLTVRSSFFCCPRAADCEAGEFTNFVGKKYQFKGKSSQSGSLARKRQTSVIGRFC